MIQEIWFLPMLFSTMAQTYSTMASNSITQVSHAIVESAASVVIPTGLYLSSLSTGALVLRHYSSTLSRIWMGTDMGRWMMHHTMRLFSFASYPRQEDTTVGRRDSFIVTELYSTAIVGGIGAGTMFRIHHIVLAPIPPIMAVEYSPVTMKESQDCEITTAKRENKWTRMESLIRRTVPKGGHMGWRDYKEKVKSRKQSQVPSGLSPTYNWTSTMNLGSSPRKTPSSGGGNLITSTLNEKRHQRIKS
jgi:hypothetical protein